MHLLGRSREAGSPQLTPQDQSVLAAFREPCLQVGEIRIQVLGLSGRASCTGKPSARAYLRTVPIARSIARLIASRLSPAA